MGTTARRVAVATLVVLGIVVAALALWKIKVVIALVFLGFIVAAAMRPSIEWLERRARIPKPLGVLVHYLIVGGLIALVTAWLGGELVYRLGVAVDDDANVDASNSLVEEGAAEVKS